MVEIAEITDVESRHQVDEEIRLAAPSGTGEGRFRHDSVPFQQDGTGKDAGQGTCRHFAEEDAPGPPDPFPAELHLRRVPAFVDRQQPGPWNRGRGHGIGHREQVHAPGRPGDGSVGRGRAAVQDDGQPALEDVAAQHAAGKAGDRPPPLQFPGINTRQRVASRGKDDLEMGRTDLLPAEPGGIASRRVELRLRGAAQQQTGTQGEDGLFENASHIAKIRIFRIFVRNPEIRCESFS